MQLEQARSLFAPEPGWLNTASYGLPPRPAWEALQAALTDWRAGRTSWEPWGEATERSRQSFARLVSADPADVTVGSTVSGLFSLVATAVPDGAEVVAPEHDFTSALFPWRVLEHRGVRTRSVPLADLADAIGPTTAAVAFSLVQSADGALAALDDVLGAAAEHGALTFVDATQAVGWLPVDATRIDALACAAYKWLLAPRGSAFLVTKPALREAMQPLQAGWYAGADVHASYYGPQMELATDARRFDTSPAWFSWVGTAPALELLEQVGVEAVRAHDVGLANRFRTGLGLTPGDSAIVALDVPDAAQRLAAAGVRAAVRAGRLRASFHLYTDDADVDRAVEALSP